MSEELKELYFRIIQFSDDELLQMVNVEYDEYRPEALKFAREELTRRGLPVEPTRTGGPPQANADVGVEGDALDVNESDTPEPSFDETEFDATNLVMQEREREAGALPAVRFEIFRSWTSSWEDLFADAAAFASRVGPENLINISHSEDSNEGVVTVWYWYR
ncbi:MAG TPA: hypothetical protein VGO91_02040 [Pyrinomonadaceae bacterium]|jgi:hypothetical protein|nr:hypothetical protein [Pyrinomonadaceae bacterium]